jgi:hypothetical protein
MCLTFGFVISCRKDFGAKAAHTMLVKLTPEEPSGLYYKNITIVNDTSRVVSE